MAGNGKRGWLPVIEDGHTLDLGYLRRQGLLRLDAVPRTSNLQWQNGRSSSPTLEVAVSCFATTEYGWLELQYYVELHGGAIKQMHEKIHLVPRPQPFGGYRLLAKCPFSGRLCRCLYLLNGSARFQSRHGYQVRPQHKTQGLPAHYRFLERRNGIAEKLLRGLPPATREAMDGSDVPPRPTGMHLKTYTRLSARWRLFNQKAEAAFEQWQEKR
jgi:hypothetical protein